MSIFNYFQNLKLTSDQQKALEMIESFLDSDGKIFILKGYAGSGKTTLIKGLVDFLRSEKKNFLLMAPTGRAAKVLRDKTGFGTTIHKGIYNFDKLETYQDESEEMAEKSYRYFFPVSEPNNTHRIAIIDEASMVSDVKAEHELFRFGSGKLLSDLVAFMQLQQAGNKIIFVGDPAQLPPFGDAESKALMDEYFLTAGVSCFSFEMKEVARQASDSLILKNATKIRNLLEQALRNDFILEVDDIQCIKIPSHEAHNQYVQDFPFPEVGNGVIISFSNSQCLTYNQMIREKLFPDSIQITGGDILLINNNNYHTYGADLFNGDMAKVLFVSPETTSQSAPVMVPSGFGKTKKTITLKFRDIVIRLPHYDRDIPCKIIDNLLNNPARDLTIFEMKALYINFVMRFEEEQKLRQARGLEKLKVGSHEFKMQLKSDPYFNALRVKYGYAITCHKAQGGEWEKAYVDFYGRVGLKNDQLRWCYTAITRASKTLFVINAPEISTFSKLKFSPVGKIGAIPANAIQYNFVACTPFHGIKSHPAKRLKYFEMIEKLADTPFEIERVESMDFQEMYFFKSDQSVFRVDAWHDQAGIFTTIKPHTKSEFSTIIEELFKKPYHHQFTIEYSPSEEFLLTLYGWIQSACADLEIQITNVAEQKENFCVTYFFRTSGIGSYIQFYFKKNGQFSTAIPKSDLGAEDDLLNQLIQKLS